MGKLKMRGKQRILSFPHCKMNPKLNEGAPAQLLGLGHTWITNPSSGCALIKPWLGEDQCRDFGSFSRNVQLRNLMFHLLDRIPDGSKGAGNSEMFRGPNLQCVSKRTLSIPLSTPFLGNPKGDSTFLGSSSPFWWPCGDLEVTQLGEEPSDPIPLEHPCSLCHSQQDSQIHRDLQPLVVMPGMQELLGMLGLSLSVTSTGKGSSLCPRGAALPGLWGEWEAPHIWRTDPDNGFGLIWGWRRFQLNWFQMCSAPQLLGERQGGAGAAFCSHLGQANSWNVIGLGELVLHLTQRKGWFGLSCFQSLHVELCRNPVRVLEKVCWRPAQEDAQTQMFPGDGGMSIPQQGLTSAAPLGSLCKHFPRG